LTDISEQCENASHNRDYEAFHRVLRIITRNEKL